MKVSSCIEVADRNQVGTAGQTELTVERPDERIARLGKNFVIEIEASGFELQVWRCLLIFFEDDLDGGQAYCARDDHEQVAAGGESIHHNGCCPSRRPLR